NAPIPATTRSEQLTNTQGVLCQVYYHTLNEFGRDPMTRYALRPLDNVGVQSGLGALNAGKISVDQFLDINQKIGGYDNNGNLVPTRSQGDPSAILATYRSGRITNGGLGLRTTPIIDYRGYVDQPQSSNEDHARFHSFTMRA